MIRNISKQEFQERLGMKSTKFNAMLAAGEIPTPRKIGRDLFWIEPVVEAYIILAFDYLMPLPPDLSPELEAEVRGAVGKLMAQVA